MGVGHADQPIRQPLRIAHIGLTVPALDTALDWYRCVLGFEILAGPSRIRAGEGHDGRLAASVFGPRLRSFRQAHLATGSGVALELFEFTEPPVAPPVAEFEYWRGGWFHLCVVEPDIAALCALIRETGGKQRTALMPTREGGPCRMCYCEDPFGNVLEIYTHPHDWTVASQATVDEDRSRPMP